ncbi:alpha/beta hydrolase [Segetibacter sp.]|uniref:alpha/beta hydrolase n=1 Tax=Segetibacter sp. TaxID=2231182 RepID=UPI00261623F6|nr:alpha/beta hydrolase [Segetibacter sp.]MCW3078934.1 lipoprotein [Segetibacter sp.]
MHLKKSFLLTTTIKLFILAFVLIVRVANAQEVIPRDTSFTVYSAFVKEQKKYPFIEIVRPQLPKGVLSKQDVVYSSIEQRHLHADVFYPAKKTKLGYPAVLLIFGGGWKSGDKSMSIPMAQRLAAEGYVAVAVEYRLSPEAKYPAAVHDIKAAIRWMRTNAAKYNIDKTKIAVHGVSAGGQLAALVGATNGIKKFEGNGGNSKQSSWVNAIVDIDGILAFKHPQSAEGQVAAEWLGGTYEQKSEVWEEASAFTHAGKNTAPILFIQSQYPRFTAGHKEMINKLNKYGIYSEVHLIPDTPHPFWLFHPWFEPTLKYTVDFLNKVFKEPKKKT